MPLTITNATFRGVPKVSLGSITSVVKRIQNSVSIIKTSNQTRHLEIVGIPSLKSNGRRITKYNTSIYASLCRFDGFRSVPWKNCKIPWLSVICCMSSSSGATKAALKKPLPLEWSTWCRSSSVPDAFSCANGWSMLAEGWNNERRAPEKKMRR